MKFDLNIENINYIKIGCKDKNDFMHCTKASIKKLNEKEIFACAKFENELNISYPQNIELSIACDNGLYKADSVLKFVERDAPYVFFTIQTPQEVEYCQNREYFRVRMFETCILSFKQDENTVRIACKTYDISANGVKLELDEKLDIPEKVQINIIFDNRELKLDAKYIRLDNDDNVYKASFQFINPSQSDVDFISQICIKKQLQDKRKSLL